MKRRKQSGKAGRPGRGDLPQRVTLYLSLKAKQKLYRLASGGGTSMGRVLEELIEQQYQEPGAEGQGEGGAGAESVEGTL